MTLVTCESAAAICVHVREVTDEFPMNLSGVRVKAPDFRRPLALCGQIIAWDTRIPVEQATCTVCRRKAGVFNPGTSILDILKEKK